MANLDVIVVGAGIIGSSIALQLRRSGARVKIVDAAQPGGIATRHSWAWINASSTSIGDYFRLRARSMEEWRVLETTLSALRVSWTGSLNWSLPPDRMPDVVAEQSAWGYETEMLDAKAIGRLEPHLSCYPDRAIRCPSEGAVDATAATAAMLQAFSELGGAIVPSCKVKRLAVSGRRVTGVITANGQFGADMVIVAAGAASPDLLMPIGLRVQVNAPPALLVMFPVPSRVLNHLIITPEVEVRQDTAGRLIACVDVDTSADEPATEKLLKLSASMREWFRLDDLPAPVHHVIAGRPIPADGLPVIGMPDDIAGLYVAVTHSGVTLAPAIGRFVSDELLVGRRDRLLNGFGLNRFQSNAPTQ